MSGRGGSSQAPSVQVPYRQQPQRNQYQNQQKPQNQQAAHKIDPIPMTYRQLWPYLIKESTVVPRPTRPREGPPFPPGYNPNITCEFHSGVAGHSIEDCHVLKGIVQ